MFIRSFIRILRPNDQIFKNMLRINPQLRPSNEVLPVVFHLDGQSEQGLCTSQCLAPGEGGWAFPRYLT